MGTASNALHPATATTAVLASRLKGVTGSPTRTIFALNGSMRRNNPGGSRAHHACYRRASTARPPARFGASPSTQDADTPATEMLPHIVFRGIGILTRRGERTPSCISPGEPDPRNVFLESLRHYPSHGAADRQPCVSMGRNCDHNPDVPPSAGLDPGLLPRRSAAGCAEPGRCHLTVAFRSMITLCLS